uniref:Uncharacterized protein n=1 Tax=Anguilla anguilla TaxID=7936 RepID=A0A0E9VBM0_ANGAN
MSLWPTNGSSLFL